MSDKKSLILLQFVISAVFTVALLYPNLYASFGIIDDHEIIVNLGSDNEMSFAELPSKLMESEAGFAKAGRSRYRPAYWMLYLTETAAWDGKPFLWYAFRLFLIGISIFIAWFLLSRFLGIVFGGISGISTVMTSILIFMGYKAIGRSAAKGAALVVFASVIAVQASYGFFAIQEASFQNMRKTVFFADNTARIISYLKVDPGAPVIFESHTFGDIEPLVSLSRYLYSHDIQNTAAVYFEERVIPQDRSSFGGMLAGRIEAFEKGDKTVPVGRLRFTPYEHLPEGKCFVISFSGDATLNCVDLGRIW